MKRRWERTLERAAGADAGLRSFARAAETTQKQKPRGGGGEEEASAKGSGVQKLAKKGEQLKEEMDALVDEIDEVLEENAEEFVKNYVQRGGE
jgi:ubiquitin-like protein Pup